MRHSHIRSIFAEQTALQLLSVGVCICGMFGCIFRMCYLMEVPYGLFIPYWCFWLSQITLFYTIVLCACTARKWIDQMDTMETIPSDRDLFVLFKKTVIDCIAKRRKYEKQSLREAVPAISNKVKKITCTEMWKGEFCISRVLYFCDAWNSWQ